jgi:hypothetical protein
MPACRTHVRSDSGPIPSCGAILVTTPSAALPLSRLDNEPHRPLPQLRRVAPLRGMCLCHRSDFSFQASEPPSHPGRFTSDCHRGVGVESSPRCCDYGSLAAFARCLVATAIAISCFVVSGGLPSAASRAAAAANSAEVVRTSVPRDLYPVEIARFSKAGYRPVWVDGFRAARRTWFNVVFRRDDGKTAWVARNDLTGGQYQAQFDTWRKAGYRPLDLESYPTPDGIRYAAIFVKAAGPRWLAYHALGEADHQARFDQLTGEGCRPVIISVTPSGGARYYTALYEKKDVGSFVSQQVLDANHYQAEMNQQSAAGRKLVYLNAYNDSAGARFTAIWYSNAVKPYARHGINARDYSAVANTQRAKGLLTRVVTGYTDGSSVRYAAFWSK